MIILRQLREETERKVDANFTRARRFFIYIDKIYAKKTLDIETTSIVVV